MAPNGGNGKIQVTLDGAQWPEFNESEVQELFNKHMRGEKKKKGNGEEPHAHIYVVLGKNPVTFSITICPQHPCSA